MPDWKKTNLAHKTTRWFATPRRLAVIVEKVTLAQNARQIIRYGPALAGAYDAAGNPTRAAQGFARSCGVAVSGLEKQQTDKGSCLVFKTLEQGMTTKKLLPDIINKALARLPVPKRMRWADGDTQFVRPVHWSVVMLGRESVPCTLLGTQSGNESYGHRFHHPAPLKLTSPAAYVKKLQGKAYVMADFEERKAVIRKLVQEAGTRAGGWAHIEEPLLDEVTSLVEWPTVIVGSFEEKFLQLPREVLIASMQDHQKYFAVTDRAGKRLLNHFITIANIDSKAPEAIKLGNEKVIRPRLGDAEFFWRRDCRRSLADYGKNLHTVIFQRQLGTLADKTERVKKLSVAIARELGANEELAQRAAALAKCDLLTEMVGEFPKLQGVMGRYYARASNEAAEVAQALDEQYMPRFAGDAVPISTSGTILAVADKLDTLVGLFGTGQQPTGSKDPFALRRAALGIIRILIESKLDLPLPELLDAAFAVYDEKIAAVHTELEAFLFERLSGHLRNMAYSSLEIDSVLCLRPARIHLVPQQLEAVRAFATLPEAATLIAANKRVANILKQAETKGESFADLSVNALQEEAEKALFATLQSTADKAHSLFNHGDFSGYLKSFAALKEPVDLFFDTIMVMTDDLMLRKNRLALLFELRLAMNRVADISRLSA